MTVSDLSDLLAALLAFKSLSIYGQHVHRTMTFIEPGKVDELDRYVEQKEIELYLTCYVSLFDAFRHLENPFD